MPYLRHADESQLDETVIMVSFCQVYSLAIKLSSSKNLFGLQYNHPWLAKFG